jgi:hypothetical protein
MMKQILVVIGLGLLLAGCVYDGYGDGGYPTTPGYGSHGWSGSPYNGGDGPGTPGVGTPG